VPQLRASQTPKLLIWGEDDTFQPVENAEYFVSQIPQSRLVRIPRAGHIPTENDAAAVARAMVEFFA
jgi:pimeloyl-ACP methyl ester carboxylesterase